jgi:hypothetical protein
MLLRTTRAARSYRPVNPTQINWASPHARGLVRLYPLAGDHRQLVPTRQTATPTFDSSAAFRGAAVIGGLAYDPSGDLNADFSTGEPIQTILPVWVGTIVWWHFPTFSPGSGVQAAMWGQHGFTSPEFSAQHYVDNNLYIGGTDTGETRITVAASAANLLQNAWNCYIYTFDGASSVLYANGISIGSSSGQSIFTGTGSLAFGNYGRVGERGANQSYQGLMAHAAIYSRKFTDADAWAAWDPATRWDVYAMPSSRVFFDIGAAGNIINVSLSIGVAGGVADGNAITMPGSSSLGSIAAIAETAGFAFSHSLAMALSSALTASMQRALNQNATLPASASVSDSATQGVAAAAPLSVSASLTATATEIISGLLALAAKDGFSGSAGFAYAGSTGLALSASLTSTIQKALNQAVALALAAHDGETARLDAVAALTLAFSSACAESASAALGASQALGVSAAVTPAAGKQLTALLQLIVAGQLLASASTISGSGPQLIHMVAEALRSAALTDLGLAQPGFGSESLN